MFMIVSLKKKANVQKNCCHKEFGLQNRYKNCFDSKWMFMCKIVLGQKKYGLKNIFCSEMFFGYERKICVEKDNVY